MFGIEVADLGVVLISAMVVFGLPAFCVALLILHNATAGILKRLEVFCFGIPSVLLLFGLVAFPPWVYHGLMWFNLMPLCALCAGALFWLWQRNRPMIFLT